MKRYFMILSYSLYSHSNNPQNLDFKNKHLRVKNATGLGVKEFLLRLMAWLCTQGDCVRITNSQMCIVTGPNIDIATKLITRLRNIFERRLGIYFDNKETVLELNSCTIQAHPSNHLDSYLALENPNFILIDEGDFFRKSEQEDNVRFVTEHYTGKGIKILKTSGWRERLQPCSIERY
jgi:hypothetical protein